MYQCGSITCDPRRVMKQRRNILYNKWLRKFAQNRKQFKPNLFKLRNPIYFKLIISLTARESRCGLRLGILIFPQWYC